MAMQGLDGDHALAPRHSTSINVSEHQPAKGLMGPPAVPGSKSDSMQQQALTVKSVQKHNVFQKGPPVRSGFLTNPWGVGKLVNGKSPAKEEDAMVLLAFASSATSSWKPKNVDRRRTSNSSVSSMDSVSSASSEVGGPMRSSSSGDAAKKAGAHKKKKPRKAYSIAGRPRARGEYKCGRCGYLPKKAKHNCEVENAKRAAGLPFSAVMEDEKGEMILA